MAHSHWPALAIMACIGSLAGCASLQTRPGHPDSYNVSLSGDGKYYENGLKTHEWPTKAEDGQKAVGGQEGALSQQPPPDYKASSVPLEIWQARGAAWNLHLKYLAASYKAEDLQDAMAIPLFGSAVATVALGIARTSTASVAATGLGGASLYAGYSYLHPDKDASTDQAAAFSLLCVVDQSLPLRTMSAIPLILDKAALQDALDQLDVDSGALMSLAAPAEPYKSAQAAVTAAQNAAKQTMTNLDTNINTYNNMPTVIYSTMDKIDQSAQTGGARTIDYSSILSGLQGSAANKSANTAAQTSNTTAKQKASGATTKLKAAGALAASTSLVAKPHPANTSNLDSVTTTTDPAKHTKSAVADPAQKTTTDPGKAGTNQNTATKLDGTLTSAATNDLEKVTKIASDANEDLAVVDYHAVAVNIQACTSGQSTPSLVTTPPASAPAAPADKSGS